jgi:hypothetical protein
MLWRSIVVAASYHNPRRQIALGWKLMEEFSTRILLKAEKSLDLLQALLVHVAWSGFLFFNFPIHDATTFICLPFANRFNRYHYHSAVNPQAMNLLALAKSMVTNLGYHRIRDFKDRSKLLIDGPDGLTTSHDAGGISSNATTLEEWRALAGCFYLTAMYNSLSLVTYQTPLTLGSGQAQPAEKLTPFNTPLIWKHLARLLRNCKSTRAIN